MCVAAVPRFEKDVCVLQQSGLAKEIRQHGKDKGGALQPQNSREEQRQEHRSKKGDTSETILTPRHKQSTKRRSYKGNNNKTKKIGKASTKKRNLKKEEAENTHNLRAGMETKKQKPHGLKVDRSQEECES